MYTQKEKERLQKKANRKYKIYITRQYLYDISPAILCLVFLVAVLITAIMIFGEVHTGQETMSNTYTCQYGDRVCTCNIGGI